MGSLIESRKNVLLSKLLLAKVFSSTSPYLAAVEPVDSALHSHNRQSARTNLTTFPAFFLGNVSLFSQIAVDLSGIRSETVDGFVM